MTAPASDFSIPTATTDLHRLNSALGLRPVKASMLFFHPPLSVDMDMVFSSYSPTRILRPFARRARIKDRLEGESHCPNPMMIECMKLGHSDLDNAADCKMQPLCDWHGAEIDSWREKRLLLT